MITLLLNAPTGCEQIIKCCCKISNETNLQDVEIAKTICCSIITLTGIIVGGFIVWKLMEHIAKGVSGYYKRKWEIEDIMRKQSAEEKKLKTDLINKKLEILHENCYETELVENNSKERKKLKEHCDENDAIGKYIDALNEEKGTNSTSTDKDSKCNG